MRIKEILDRLSETLPQSFATQNEINTQPPEWVRQSEFEPITEVIKDPLRSPPIVIDLEDWQPINFEELDSELDGASILGKRDFYI